MRTGKYSFKELFVNRYVARIVIPEIQRDYVWGEQQVGGFLDSLFEAFCQFRDAKDPLGDVELNSELKEGFRDYYRQRHFSANIGFIYAYSDEAYQGRYFLIDGQQRITTLYICLLLLANRNGLMDEFQKNYVRSDEPVLDYRVRDTSSEFIKNLVRHGMTNPDLDVTDQLWYLAECKNDKTVTSIVSNLAYARAWLDEHSLDRGDEVEFFHYLQSMTECWYFDTNISAQGENLYIYLNARGEQVEENENIKADLLSRLTNNSDKNAWGDKWERWQDLFWRNRGRKGSKNPSADKGFNSFISCIAGLKCYEEGDLRLLVDKKSSKSIAVTEISPLLSLERIEDYVDVLCYLDEHKEAFKAVYAYAGWVDKCVDQLWFIINSDNTHWFIDYHRPQDFSAEARKMVFVWGIFLLVRKSMEAERPISFVFRGIRQLYLRYHNNIRSVVSLSANIDQLLTTGFIASEKDLKEEESVKERWLADVPNVVDRQALESVIWEIEDHPLNLDGADVGAVNISHLISFDESLEVGSLCRVRDLFNDLFKGGVASSAKKLQSVLLYYGEYWRGTTPKSYQSYAFSDWKYVIRGLPRNSAFKACFDELLASGGGVAELLERKRSEYEPDIRRSELRQQLLWYNFHLKERMWDRGDKIVICSSYEGHRFDLVFPERRVFHNLRSDFRSNDFSVLSRLLPDEVRARVKKEREL